MFIERKTRFFTLIACLTAPLMGGCAGETDATAQESATDLSSASSAAGGDRDLAAEGAAADDAAARMALPVGLLLESEAGATRTVTDREKIRDLHVEAVRQRVDRPNLESSDSEGFRLDTKGYVQKGPGTR